MPESFPKRTLAACVVIALWPALGAAAPETENARLRDTRWELQSLDGVPVPGGDAMTGVYLVLHKDSQQVSGFAGCNSIRGRYTQRGTQLAVSALASTRKACPPPQMQQEQRFIELLGAADAYRIEGSAMSLLQGETVRLRFKAVGKN